MPIYAFIFSLIVLSAFAPSGAIQAQGTPIQQAQIRAELQRRNIDEQELKLRLQQRGIDVDKMNAAQLAAARTEIETVIAEMEDEARLEAANAIDTLPTPAVEDSLSQPVRAAVLSPDPPQDLPESEIWGHQVFRNKSLQVYQPNDNVLPPDSYRLGPGDQLGISIFGASQADLKLIIDSDGFIRPARMPRIYLKGLPIRQARELLENRFRQYYVFQNGQFALTLDAARTITVNIFGEVEQSGSYTLSAANTAFNALVAAGGPKETGSVRRIKILRGGEERLVDVYAFLLDPTRSADLYLESNDVIFVPAAKTIVEVTGAVRRPLRYEILDEEGLNAAIDFASGFTPNAIPEGITIIRTEGNQETVLDGNYVAGEVGRGLQSSDVINVPSSGVQERRFVSISGDVIIPGEYALIDGMTAADLLRKGGLKNSSRRDVGFLRRYNTDSTASLLPLSYFDILENPAESPTLQSGDELIVFSQTTYASPATIAVSGAVRQPLSDFPYSANGELTVEDAILLAGGLLANASEQAFLIRKNPENIEQRQYVRLDLSEDLSLERQLRPFDSLIVYTTERFNDPFPVSIRGAVRQPGTYVYDPSLGFSDLFTLAGGLRFEAARNRVDVFRLQYDQNDATRTINTALEIDENFAITGGPPGFSLQPYDVVVVRSVPEFELIRTVTVAGEVRYPGDYALDSDNLRLTDLVDKAGGLTAEAFPAGATLLREENEVGLVVIQLDEVLRDNKAVTNITLKEGDALFVPKARDLVAIRPLGTQAPQFVNDSLYVDGTLDVAFAGKKSGKWYINNYAAGFATNARRRSLTVQYPNGELGRTKKFLWFNNYPEVRPGSLIRIDTKKPKRQRKEREEPVDWVGITQATLAGVTTLLTLFILVRQTNN